MLPFQNLSGDPNQEYFSDGMTEVLISSLAQIHALDVTSRTSVMRFKATKQSIPEIGRTLGVDAIVESSVQRAGNRVRIIAQLIRASTDTHLWAKEFNGSTSDLLELQSDVARAIVEELRAQVTPEERKRLSNVPKVLPEAQDAFLVGRYQFWRNDWDGYKQAIGSYQRAIDLQPDYAAAYAALSLALRDLQNAGGPGAHDEIRKAAFKAMELDPNLAEAHAAVGAVSTDDWEWERAEQAFRKAIEINPDSQDTCHCYAALLSILGRHAGIRRADAALGQGESPVLGVLRQSRRAPVRGPTVSGGDGGATSSARDGTGECQRAFLSCPRVSGDRQAGGHRSRVRPSSLQGDIDHALCARSGGTSTGSRRTPPPGIGGPHPRDSRNLALAHAWLGDKDRAFEWLTKAFDARATYVEWAKVSPLFDVFRGDPRFDALLARLHLPT